MLSKISSIESFLSSLLNRIGVKETNFVCSENTYNDMDSYFLQSLVQTRYFGTVDIVWVYGCADKT
jgi:regulator of sirC expression with transglutaminase-like and TPR domain